MLFSLILASTLNGGIGNNGKIPWNLKDEMDIFKQITTNVNCYLKKNAVIMGYDTWISLPLKPLKNRINIILTSKKNVIKETDDIKVFDDFDNALNFCEDTIYIDKVYVIGGKSLYYLCLNNKKYFNQIDKIHLSIIYHNYNCDTFINLKQILKLHKYYDFNEVKFYKDFINLTYNLRNC
jgi:dihydrofolate reductase